MHDSHPPAWLHLRTVLVLLLSSLGVAGPLLAQDVSKDPIFAEVPFEQWLAEGPHEDLPWKVSVRSTGLSNYQRLLARVEVEVPGEEPAKRNVQSRPIVLIQFTDRQGRAYQNHWVPASLDTGPVGDQKSLVFSWDAFVLPGEYDVAVALYDSATGEHNFTRRSLSVPPLGKEPLPGAWRDLTSVEFLGSASGLDRFFHPEVLGRLRLPLVTRRPVRIELLVNLSPSERLTASHRVHSLNLGMLLPTLKTFSEIDVRHGSLGVVALDLTRRRVSFEQEDARNLDWPALKAAVTAANPSAIDVASLLNRKQNAAFLRDELARRIEADCGAPAEQAGSPLHVYIVLSSPMAFDSPGHPSPIPGPRKGCCVVYYVRYQLDIAERVFLPPKEGPDRASESLSGLAALDDIANILKPLNPRVFSVHSPEGVRNALTFILDRTSQM